MGGCSRGGRIVVFRLKVTSKKLMVCLLASMVIRSPLLKMRQIYFLMFSVSLGVAFEMASPSSLYSPMLSFCCWERRKFPSSSHVSAPS